MERDCTEHQEISIHSPHTGRDSSVCSALPTLGDFNPLSPHGERLARAEALRACCYFNPLSPHGERPNGYCCKSARNNFNPLSPHGERQAPAAPANNGYQISIHSPHTGRDVVCRQRSRQQEHFNPLSPHGERLTAIGTGPGGTDFNPLSPHGERLRQTTSCSISPPISIHSPHTGRDNYSRC